MILLFVMLFSCVSVNAATEYVEADTVLKYDSNGYVSNLDTLLNKCKMSKKSAKFSDKVYKFNQNITIPDGISFVGSNNTVFQGYNGEYQLNIFDDANGTSNIEIKNIIFDNFTIYANKSSKSSNWTIENNVFVTIWL